MESMPPKAFWLLLLFILTWLEVCRIFCLDSPDNQKLYLNMKRRMQTNPNIFCDMRLQYMINPSHRTYKTVMLPTYMVPRSLRGSSRLVPLLPQRRHRCYSTPRFECSCSWLASSQFQLIVFLLSYFHLQHLYSPAARRISAPSLQRHMSRTLCRNLYKQCQTRHPPGEGQYAEETRVFVRWLRTILHYELLQSLLLNRVLFFKRKK